MNLKLKRKNELEEQKDLRKKIVIEAAIEVFEEKGIENSKMTDIAEKAEIGIASLYRYFKTKTEIVIEAAIEYWGREVETFISDFESENFKTLNGKERVSKILELFIDMYKYEKPFMRFIEEFDNYIVKENIPAERLNLYEKHIISLMPIMLEAMEVGKKDESIKADINNEVFYITITHTFISLCQKLILRNSILNSDKAIEGEKQLRLIKDMALNYIDSD